MIEAVVAALLRILATPAVAEFSLLWGLEAEIQRLKDELVMIEAVLEEAEEREHKEKSVWIWRRNLRDMAYDAVDVFDELNMEAALHPKLLAEADAGVTSRSVRLVSACFLSCFTATPNPIPFRHQMGSRIQDIMARLGGIKERKQGLLGLTVERNCPESSKTRETSSLLDKDQPLLGRDAHKQQLIEILCAPDDCVPRLVPIVGMGGIGKTTLAQAVYNDDIVKGQFPVRKWVFVGEKFDAWKIIEQVLSEASREQIAKNRNPSLEDLHRYLISEIADKRFLIVLDDVWSKKSEEWEQVWCPFKYGAKGAKVLVTTRTEEVAMMMGPVPFSLTMEPLSDNDCWSIFERCAFVDGKSEGNPVLKAMGMEIVRRLNGIPLAAKLIGGALLRNFTETYWRRLMNSDIWLQNLNEEGVLPSLLLSYHAFPSHLKPCFQFCSLFPKDHRFHRETLVWMWMAHDFIQPVGGERMEDVGSRYFDELLQRSFFQYINDSYVMHDLIHDLAQFISKGECLRIEDKKQSCSEPDSIRHLSLYCEQDKFEPKDLYQFNRARTLLDGWGRFIVTSDRIFCQLLGRLKCMRVLDLSGCKGHRSLPQCISDLKHLRYLDLRNRWIEELPESLCTLYNLQTLRVSWKCRLPPKGMSKLVNLRTLEADGEDISRIPGIGRLTCLQELRGLFRVSKEKGYRIGELKGMNQLRGTLRIWNLEKVGSMEEAAGIQLKDKVLLHRLELVWCGRGEYKKSTERVADALQPPRELKEMLLLNHPGSQPPCWMTQGPPLLSNLVTLQLYGCKNYTCLSSALGRLPCLKSLVIERMDGVKQVGPEFHCCGSSSSDVVAFPSLEELQFRGMNGLERWVDGSGDKEEEEESKDDNTVLWQGDDQQSPYHKYPLLKCSCFPCLRLLHFEYCPKLATIYKLLRHHQLDALQHLVISDCDELVRLSGGGEEVGKLPLHWAPKRMLQILDIVRCPKLAWSEVEPLLLLHASSSSSSLRALRVYLNDDKWRWPHNLNHVLRKASPAKESTAPEFVATNKRELLSWLLQPGRRSLESLTYLEIKHCDELTALMAVEEEEGWLRNLPSLRTLSIAFCPRILAWLERGLPPTLRTLAFVGCSNLHSLPRELRNLTSLVQLCVEKCPLIQALPVPPILRTLDIRDCPLLEEVTWLEMEPHLTGSSSSSHSPSSSSSSPSSMTPPVQVEYLLTDNRRLLSWLLRQPRRLDSLRQLRIRGCEDLGTFTEEEEDGWRRNLPSLERLIIEDCPNLLSLPEGLHIHTEIEKCPKLQRRPSWVGDPYLGRILTQADLAEG